MRTLAEIEQHFRDEFDAMPESFRDQNATEFYLFVNVLRKARFNVPCGECEDCGFLFPRDDLSLVTKSDKNSYWQCCECRTFGNWIRAVFRDRAA